MVTTPTFWGAQATFSSAANAGASKVTGLLDNNFAITWQDALGDIHGRRFDPLGSFNSTDFLFNLSQNTSQQVRTPELIQQRDGALGTYFNLTASPTNGDVYINVPDFGTTGGRTSKATVLDGAIDEFMRDATATEFNNTPSSAIVSTQPRGTGGINDLYLSHLTSGGLVYGSPQIVPIGTGETVIDARVTGLGNGNTLVSYEVFNSVSSERFVRYRVYDDYTDLTGARNASSTPGNDSFPAAIALPNSSDGFVIVTQDALGLRFLYNGYGQTFTKSVPGTTSSGGGAFAKAIAPRITGLDDGGFIIAWIDTTEVEGDGSPALKIGLQRFDKNSNAVGGNLFINNPGDQSLESIATLDDGRVILTYTNETGDSTNQTTLAYRIIDPRDSTIFGTNRDDNIVSREDGARIIAGAGADTLIGRAGADKLDGETGNDTMTGAAGNDTYFVDSVADRVIELAGNGSDKILTTVNYKLTSAQDIELLSSADPSSTAPLNLAGNQLSQKLYGNAGANVLDGKGGADLLRGFGGNDIYLVDNVGDLAVEAGNGGTDTVRSLVSYTLGANVEKLTLIGTGSVKATGNTLGNTITGNDGANVLAGGLGNDRLDGGDGRDAFLFNTALRSTNVDQITAFSVADDAIQLENSIFRGLTAGALTAGAFKDITDGAALDADDRILYDHDTGRLFFDADGGGARARVEFAVLENDPTLTYRDFLVV